MSVTEGPGARLQALFEGHRLTPTQRRIAHSMVRRAADVPFLSSVELAELAGVSQPSKPRATAKRVTDGWLTPASSASSTLDRNGTSAARRTMLCAMRRWVGVSRCPSKSA